MSNWRQILSWKVAKEWKKGARVRLKYDYDSGWGKSLPEGTEGTILDPVYNDPLLGIFMLVQFDGVYATPRMFLGYTGLRGDGWMLKEPQLELI